MCVWRRSVSPLNGSGLARLSRVYGSLSRESSFSWVSVSLEAKPTQRQRVTNAACSRLCNAHGIRTIIGDDTKVKCELSICAEDARCLLLPQEGVLSPDVRQLSLCRSGSQLRTTLATIFIITIVTIITNTKNHLQFNYFFPLISAAAAQRNPATLVSTDPVIVSFLLMRRCLRLVRLLGLFQLVLHLCGSLPETEKTW